MARYGTGEDETLGTDLVAGGTAMLVGYFLGTWAKATGGALWPAITAATAGAAGTVLKHAEGIARRPYWHETVEAIGYGGLYSTGTVLAASTTTLGGVPAGVVPLNIRPAPATTTTTAAERAAAAARAQQAAAARALAVPTIPQVQPKNPNASYPQVSPYGGYEVDLAG